MAGDGEQKRKDVVCVTGAAGFIGSWLVMRLLEQGFKVNATVRDPANIKKTKHLTDLPCAKERLTLWKADLCDEGSFDEPMKGCTGVFHVATPMDFESQDPENEVIKPTVDGMLNIMRSCLKAKTVRRIVFTSSAGTIGVQAQRKTSYDENDWGDVEFMRRVKMTGWMYFVSKTLAEKAAWDFAKEHNLDLITIIPTLVVGPFLMPNMPPSLLTALAIPLGNESHYSILKEVQLVHLDDLCNCHIFLLDHPEAKGRYICSNVDITIYEIADMLRKKYPEFNIPTKFEGIDKETLEHVHFNSKKLVDLGFKYQYTTEDMYDGAISCCRERKLLPSIDECKNKSLTNGNGNSKHVV